MAITYSVKINGVRVQSQDTLTDVVKQVDASMTGTDGEASFTLPFQVQLPEADAETFTTFASLTEAQLVTWVEAETEKLESIKAHIALVVEKEVEKLAMTQKPLPWAPVEPEAPTGSSPEAE